jgi:hypothetical protein
MKRPKPPAAADEISAALTPTQRRLYEIVRDAGDAGILGRAIREKLYAHDPDGGPASLNIVSVHAMLANKRLWPFRIAIEVERRIWRVVDL